MNKIHIPTWTGNARFLPQGFSLTRLPLSEWRLNQILFICVCGVQASKSSLVILLLSLVFNFPQGRKICFTCNLSTWQYPNHFISQWNVVISTARKLVVMLAINKHYPCSLHICPISKNPSASRNVLATLMYHHDPKCIQIFLGTGSPKLEGLTVGADIFFSAILFPFIKTPDFWWLCLLVGPMRTWLIMRTLHFPQLS